MHRLPVTLADLLPPAKHEGTITRSAGLHVTDVVYDLCHRLEPGRYPAKNYQRQDRGIVTPNARMELGSLIEDVIGDALVTRLTQYHPDSVVRLGEIEMDGLIGTPDFYLLETPPLFGFQDKDPTPAVGESKGTWLSTKHDIDSGKFNYWLWQGKSYCCMLNTPRLILLPFFVNGNYRFDDPGGGPQFVPYGGDFTRQELDEHWHMMTQHAARMRTKYGL